MKNFNENKENNLYGWAMSQKLPVNGSKCQKTYLSLLKVL